MSARRRLVGSAPGPSVAIVAAICGAEILGLAGFSIVPALLPQFIEAWSLTNTQAGWLAGIRLSRTNSIRSDAATAHCSAAGASGMQSGIVGRSSVER